MLELAWPWTAWAMSSIVHDDPFLAAEFNTNCQQSPACCHTLPNDGSDKQKGVGADWQGDFPRVCIVN